MVRVTIDHRVEPVIVILLNDKAVMLPSLCPYLYLQTWAALSLGLGIIILHWATVIGEIDVHLVNVLSMADSLLSLEQVICINH